MSNVNRHALLNGGSNRHNALRERSRPGIVLLRFFPVG